MLSRADLSLTLHAFSSSARSTVSVGSSSAAAEVSSASMISLMAPLSVSETLPQSRTYDRGQQPSVSADIRCRLAKTRFLKEALIPADWLPQ